MGLTITASRDTGSRLVSWQTPVSVIEMLEGVSHWIAHFTDANRLHHSGVFQLQLYQLSIKPSGDLLSVRFDASYVMTIRNRQGLQQGLHLCLSGERQGVRMGGGGGGAKGHTLK